jgi:hypothetical protein
MGPGLAFSRSLIAISSARAAGLLSRMGREILADYRLACIPG